MSEVESLYIIDEHDPTRNTSEDRDHRRRPEMTTHHQRYGFARRNLHPGAAWAWEGTEDSEAEAGAEA